MLRLYEAFLLLLPEIAEETKEDELDIGYYRR